MIPQFLSEPGHVDEPQQAGDYAAVLSQVAKYGQPLIVRRNGTDLAAVVSLQQWELMREVLATQEAERIASELDVERLAKVSPPASAWFDGDEPKPF
jgi:hypothetical protein